MSRLSAAVLAYECTVFPFAWRFSAEHWMVVVSYSHLAILRALETCDSAPLLCENSLRLATYLGKYRETAPDIDVDCVLYPVYSTVSDSSDLCTISRERPSWVFEVNCTRIALYSSII